MTCTDALSAMLVADREVLRGEGDSRLARHVRRCGACRLAATALEAEIAVLAVRVIARGREVPLVERGPARRIGWRAAILATLPIAATVIAVVVLRRGTDRQPVPRSLERRAPAVVSVDVAPGQNAAVIKTSDPNVTIVWLSSGGGK
jgi:hypothetical protein